MGRNRYTLHPAHACLMILHHRQILSLIQSILDDWDPLELLAAGAPADEHADEAARLLARLPITHHRLPAAAPPAHGDG